MVALKNDMIDNVKIRPLEIQDAMTSYRWRNDKEVFKYTGNTYDHEITYEMELEWIKCVISKQNDYRCAILVDGVYVGNIYLTDIYDGRAEYHIFIGDRNYWGRSVASEASRLILRYAFDELNLDYVFLEVRKDNTKAIRLYERLGFRQMEQDGEWIKMIINNQIKTQN